MSQHANLPGAVRPQLIGRSWRSSFIAATVFSVLVMVGVPCGTTRAGAMGSEKVIPDEFLDHASDYGFMWWPYGWRGRSPEGHRVFCVQTNRYGLAFDVDEGSLTQLGPITRPLPEAEALVQSNDVVFDLPAVRLAVTLEADGRTYRSAGVAPKPEDVHIIDHGRFLQRIRMVELHFEDAEGQPPPGKFEAWYELICWPDRLAVLVSIKHTRYFVNPVLTIGLVCEDERWSVNQPTGHSRMASLPGTDAGVALVRTPGAAWPDDDALPQERCLAVRSIPADFWEGDRNRTLGLVLLPFSKGDRIPLHDRIAAETGPQEARTLRATGIAPYGHPLEVAYDHHAGAYRVRLGDVDGDGWLPVKDPDRLERVRLAFDNRGNAARTARVLFSREDSFRGLTGFTPMLRDTAGRPVGLPVQISKNWHNHHWFHGPTMARLPSDEQIDAEFTIAYANWGGVPAVSHAQLCLVGWGTNQLWHEVAISSFGESICYDPDVCLNRSMIDDMRPLLVRGWTHPDWWRHPQGGWTNNVGGGDFLVYFDEHGKKQFLGRMRTSYRRYGPNLSEVVYAGHTPDGRIDARINVMHGRSDDYVRAFYRVRYDVNEPTTWERLAFFQLGADGYNDHQFDTIARGHADGLLEEWSVQRGEPGYNRTGIACEGRLPWFSLHDAIGKPHKGSEVYRPERDGAWANRGVIVRRWEARLGGRDVAMPYAAEYRTTNGPPSALIELTPPPDITALEPGDYVEADIELLVLPMHAEDYYGPNEALRAALQEHGNTWRLVHREAVGNDLQISVTSGRLGRSFPPLVDCGEQGQAEFSIAGGIGYVPVTISGVRDYMRCVLEERTGAGWSLIDQSVHGNDFWQSEFDARNRTWDLTFNINGDVAAPRGDARAFRLR